MTQPPRIGIFGGTFDPPHIGHLILAAEARHQLGLAEVLFVLTADPPHKQDRQITPLEQRLAMLAAALDGQSAFTLSRVEIDRPGPHYALDTVALLRETYPDQHLVYLIGGDSLRDLPTWREPARLLKSIDILGVMRRPFTELDLDALHQQLPQLEGKLEFVNSPLLEISSREIRARVVNGGHFRFFLPPNVYAYIQEHQLYR